VTFEYNIIIYYYIANVGLNIVWLTLPPPHRIVIIFHTNTQSRARWHDKFQYLFVSHPVYTVWPIIMWLMPMNLILHCRRLLQPFTAEIIITTTAVINRRVFATGEGCSSDIMPFWRTRLLFSLTQNYIRELLTRILKFANSLAFYTFPHFTVLSAAV